MMTVDDHNDIDDDDSISSNDEDDIDEGFRLLIGENVMESINSSAWDNASIQEEDHNVNDDILISNNNTTPIIKNNNNNNNHMNNKPKLWSLTNTTMNNNSDIIYSLAYSSNNNNNNNINANDIQDNNHPPVKIVNMGIEKGNGLIVTQSIKKGQVIYTERAAIATQSIQNHDGSSQQNECRYCCSNCFRSMEPISSCQNILYKNNSKEHQKYNHDDNMIHQTNDESMTTMDNHLKCEHIIKEFPLSYLWPILPLQFDDDMNNNINNDKSIRSDKYGRIQCGTCQTLFCSEQCYKVFSNELGSCCLLKKVQDALPHIIQNNQQRYHHHQNLEDVVNIDNNDGDDNNEHNDDDEDDNDSSVQSSIQLAVRMFAYKIQEYRNNQQIGHNSTDLLLQQNGNSILDDLCGSVLELNILELGILQRQSHIIDNNNDDDIQHDDDMTTSSYTLEPIYNYIIDLWSLSMEEQIILSYNTFVLLTVQAARNGFGIRTQSPFQTYYSNVLRSIGGRNSIRYDDTKQHIMNALGVLSFNRTTMNDNIINERVAPTLCGLYILTSRINHSCTPYYNAQVYCQSYIDYNIDIIATRDIDIGEEIFISYIHDNSSTSNNRHMKKHKRQNELQKKYLFHCQCISCQEE